MAQVVGQLMIEMAANVARLQTDMAKATKTVDGAMASIVKSVDVAKKALTGLISVEIINRMAQASKAAIDMADGLGELSEKTGVSVEQLSGLRVAFQLNALQADQVGAVMKRLSVSIAKGADAFGAMGIQVKNVDGTLKSTDRILLEVADKFASYRDGAEKAALAVNLFGKSGADLIPVLNQGSDGLQAFIDKAAEFGILIDQDTAAAAGKFNDQLDMLGMTSQGLWVQFSAQLLPIMTSLLETFRQGENDTNIMKTAMDGLANSIKIVYSLFVGLGAAMNTAINIGSGLIDIVGARITGGSEARAAEAAKVRAKIADDLRVSGEQLERIWQNTTEAVETAKAASVKSADNMAKVVAPSIKKVTEETQKQGAAAKIATVQTRDYNDAHLAAFDAHKKAVQSAQEMVAQIEFETQTLKMSNVEREQAIALRELERKGLDTTSEAYKQYAAEVKNAISGREAVQAAIDEQERAKAYWDRLWDDVGRSLTDALMQGGMNARQLLEGTFRTMILRPTIEGVVQPITQSISKEIMGSAAGGAIGASMKGAMASMAAYAAPAAMVIGAALIGKEIGSRIAGEFKVFDGNLGKLVEWTGVIGGVFNRAFGMGKERVQASTISGTFGAGGADLMSQVLTRQRGGLFRSNRYRTYEEQITGETDAILDAQVQTIRAQVINASKALGLYSNAVGDFTQSINLNMKDLTDEQKQQALADALAGFGDAFAAYASAGVAQSLEDLITAATNFTSVNAVFEMLGYTAIKAEAATIKMTNALVDALGGLEQFAQKTGFFFEKFYTEAERQAYNQQFLTNELAKLGAQLPLTRNEFKFLVNSMDLMTESGRNAYVSLLNLAPQVDAYITTLEAAAEAQIRLQEQQTQEYEQAQANLLKQIKDNSDEIARINREMADAAEASAKRIADAIIQSLQDSARAAEQFAGMLKKAAMTQLDAQIAASRDAGQAARRSAQDYAEAAKSIKQVSDELYLAALGQKESLAFLRGQYNSLLTRARSGDVSAMQQVGGAAQAFLGASKGMAATRADFIKQTLLIQNQLDETIAVAAGQKSVAEYQALLYEANTTLLELTKQNLSQGEVDQALLREQIAELGKLAVAIDRSGSITVSELENVGFNTATTVSAVDLVAASSKTSEVLLSQLVSAMNAFIGANQQTAAARQAAERQAQEESQRRLAQQQAEEARKQKELEDARIAAEQERLRLMEQQRILEQQRADEIRRQQEAAAAAARAEQERLDAIRRQQESTAAAEKARQDEINLANFYMHVIKQRVEQLVGSIPSGMSIDQAINTSAALYAWSSPTAFASQIAELQKMQQDLAMLRAQITRLGGAPAFADGGMHSGGLRLVGENGPELEVTGPARIYNAQQTAGMLAGGADMVAELRLLRQEVNELRFEARATATNTNKTQRLLERVTLDGEAMQTVAYS